MEKKEKRDVVLYVKITKTNKKFLQSRKDELNYPSLGEYVDDLISEAVKNGHTRKPKRLTKGSRVNKKAANTSKTGGKARNNTSGRRSK